MRPLEPGRRTDKYFTNDIVTLIESDTTLIVIIGKLELLMTGISARHRPAEFHITERLKCGRRITQPEPMQ